MDKGHRRHSYRLFGAGMLLAAVVAIGVMLWTVFRTPSLPANWQLVRPGMNRLEVWRATHPGRASPGRELGGGIGDGQGAGGETQGKPYRALFWQKEWQLHVIYGEDGRAEQVATRYIGPFSRRDRSWGSDPRRAEDGWNVQRSETTPPLRPCDFPTKPGTYKSGEWEYIYEIGHPGSQSERRTGRLLRNGAEVTGKPGEVLDTPLGRFLYFGQATFFAYTVGWLNTVHGEQPVFDGNGRVLAKWYMLHIPTEEEAKTMSAAAGAGIRPHECQPGPDRRVFCPVDRTVFAFDADRKLVWKHEAKYAVFVRGVAFNSRSDVLIASVGKGTGGELWCLAADGKVRWMQEVRVGHLLVNSRDQVIYDHFEQAEGLDLTCLSRDGELVWRVEEKGMSIEGMDGADTILARHGATKAWFSRLYSAEGRVLWSDGPYEFATNHPYIGAGGKYVVPGSKTTENAPSGGK